MVRGERGMSEQKHYSAGNVFGRIVDEVKKEESREGKLYISFTVNISGRRCGSARAFCRMWGEERYEPFLRYLERCPAAAFWFKGFFSQYWDPKNNVFSNFTIFQWEARESDPRAAFILKGLVDQAQKVKTGQRILLDVERQGQPKERFEIWNPRELLLDEVAPGQFVEVKGYIRQETPEDDFGGSTGLIRAYAHQLRVL
jgi:hypothetical protein